MAYRCKFNNVKYIKPVPYHKPSNQSNSWDPIVALIPYGKVSFYYIPNDYGYPCSIKQNSLLEIIKEHKKYKIIKTLLGNEKIYHNIELFDINNMKKYRLLIKKDFSLKNFKQFFTCYDSIGNIIT
jgi:hypothetical protein